VSTDDLLRVEHLSVEFRTELGWVRVVDNVSFTLPRGSTLGLVGESGSGKTVTALAMMGLVAPRSSRVTGSVVLDGRELVGLSEREMSRVRGAQMAMVFQEPRRSLDPAFTVGDQIAEVLVRHEGQSRREAWDRAVGLLERVGIPDPGRRAKSYPHQFSGGMCQRVMLAMAMACKPKVLIADEPTTALDVTVQKEMLALITELTDSFGVSVLFITHDLGVISEVCEDLAVMYAGQVVEFAGLDDVLSSPRHPYTEGLLAAMPSTIMGARRLRSIPGAVPAPHEWPISCRFAERCAYVDEARCLAAPVALIASDAAHAARCVREEELSLKGVG
jgi:oligopeptide/dipeptide ABC transporter ATP-binding protein